MAPANPLLAPKPRLFLALWPDEDIRAQVAAHADQWTWPNDCARYRPADWHVTLHFIGHADVNRIAFMAANAGVRPQPFDLLLDRPMLWPRGLAVLGATEVPEPLLALHDRLGHTLRGLDLPIETRPYQPHVTLARYADAAKPPIASPPVVWRVSGFALVASTGNKNARYQVIRAYH